MPLAFSVSVFVGLTKLNTLGLNLAKLANNFCAIAFGRVRSLTSAFATLLSLIPPAEYPHEHLFLVKIIGSKGALFSVWLLTYFLARRRETLPAATGET